jgi:threonine dehydrogenase-like Zn-dependent dehydrogenase
MMYKVPAGVSAGEASFYLPLANGIRWVQQIAGAGSGDTVVIQGPGQQGLGCVIGAKEAGVSCIIVSGLKKDARRLEAARSLGADFTVCVEEEDLISRVEEITDGRMADLVVDVSHEATEPVVMALRLVKKCGGRIILAGAKHRPVPDFPTDEILYREITITGVRGHDFRSIEPALRIIASHRYPLQLLGTHQFTLSETEEAVLTVGGEGKPEAIHVTVLPWA